MDIDININWIIGSLICVGCLIDGLISGNMIWKYIGTAGLIYLLRSNK